MAIEMEDEGKEAMLRLAAKRAAKQSKIGKRLDRLDASDAPRRPFLMKAKKK